jgi:tripartite-type tricarboxylate transporter receptor subunit TctC
MGQFSSHVVPGAITNLPYDAERDFEPVGGLGRLRLLLYAKKTMPGKDLQELIAWLKANPGKASHGNVTATMHAFAALFQKEYRYAISICSFTEAKLLPYKFVGRTHRTWCGPQPPV